MVRTKAAIPEGHGEVFTQPPFESWQEILRANAAAAQSWDFEVCSTPIGELRTRGRAEAVELSREACARLEIGVAQVDPQPQLLVMTGHQPELYHPGIWAKDFLLQRLADQAGAAAIDLVVDSDAFETVGIHSPCMLPSVGVCSAYLAVGEKDRSYATAPVPSPTDVDLFCRAGSEQLATLPAPALGRHWMTFCNGLREARALAGNIAELVTVARRRYEAAAGTDYLELPVTSQAGSETFAAFVGDMALRAPEFAEAYNAELASFRERSGTRSPAQPFPDLRVEGDLVELPIWDLSGGRRTVWARTGARRALVAEGIEDVVLPSACAEVPGAIKTSGLRLGPKALALTLFNRVFVADLFIHGVGGGRYDRVTDGVIRRFYGIEPPAYVLASMTMYLPLGGHIVSEEEVDLATQRLNRLTQNPDQLLGEMDFEDPAQRQRADALAEEKRQLIAEIAVAGADKKRIGGRIRQVNEELAGILEPLERELGEHLERLKQMREASEILTDRTYPFCFWSPLEVADKVR